MRRLLSIIHALLCIQLIPLYESFQPAVRSVDRRGVLVPHSRFVVSLPSSRSTVIQGVNSTIDAPLYQSDELILSQKAQSSNLLSDAYGNFSRENPFWNSNLIATVRAGLSDILAQDVEPMDSFDYPRFLFFCAFGFLYSGVFQYVYQVQFFNQIFGRDELSRFTDQPWADKLSDKKGLQTLANQIALDMLIASAVYLPSFYVFKAFVFSGESTPVASLHSGLNAWWQNFAVDEPDLLKVWMPADLVIFSVPMFLRLPMRHFLSLFWTAYLSLMHGTS